MDNESAEKQAHIVKAGDSLWKIVQNRYNGLSNAEISRKVNEIAALNELDDPGQIKAGDKLLFPTENIKHGSREYFLNISKALFAGEDPPLEPIQNSEHSDRATDEDMLPRFQQLTEDQRVMLVHYLDELYAHEIPQGSDIITFYREKVAADLLGKGPDRQALHDYIIADLDRASELQNHLFQEMGTGTSSEKTESLSEKDGKASSLNEAHNAEIAKTVEMGTVNVPDDTHPTAEELIADFSTRLENGEITIRDVKRELETRDIPDEIAQQVLVCEEIAGPESGSYEIHLVSAEQLVIDVQTALAMSADIIIDGMFGPETSKALQNSLMDAQERAGIEVTGKYTEETKDALLKTMNMLTPDTAQHNGFKMLIEALDTLKIRQAGNGHSVLDTIYRPQGNCDANVSCSITQIKPGVPSP